MGAELGTPLPLNILDVREVSQVVWNTIQFGSQWNNNYEQIQITINYQYIVFLHGNAC